MTPDQLHNRQGNTPEKQTKTSIKERLKNYMDNVTIDVFGYEKKIPQNIIKYLDKVSDHNNISTKQLLVRITKKKSSLRVFLHYNTKLLREIPVKELINIFAGKQVSEIPDAQKKIIAQVGKYLDDFAQNNDIILEELSVLISCPESDVKIVACNGQYHARDIAIKELIKYFKA